MPFEIPKENETVTIEGVVYGHPAVVMKFPPNPDLKRVQSAMRAWNDDSKHKRAGLRFSVVNIRMSAKQESEFKKIGGLPKELLGDRYTLCSWQRIGYTKEYEKTHPWVNYDSYRDWQEAMEKKKAGKR
jgi:hypothetical protein